MTPTITAFAHSPDKGQGLARDMRVRWALEEVGRPYDVKLVSFDEMKQPDYLKLQPFGQIPAYIDGDLTLFETGSIILHIAQLYPGLLPDHPNARARAITWMFAALNTVEPPIVELEAAMLTEREEDWFDRRLPLLHQRIRDRLDRLSATLGDKDWLEHEFTAGDLMMVMVLRRLSEWRRSPEGSGADGDSIAENYPNLASYVARGTVRPAYKRAYAAQLDVFTGSVMGGA